MLLISDHLSWKDEAAHFSALEKKLQSYVEFIVSDQHVGRLPGSEHWPVRIKLIHEQTPTVSANKILDSLRDQMRTIGIRFSRESLPAKYRK